MSELRDENFRETYIGDCCLRLLDVHIDKQQIRFIDEGMLNYVYEVPTKKGTVFFKQALTRAKCASSLAPTLGHLSSSRTKCEAKVISKLKPLLPSRFRIPTAIRSSPDG